MSYNKAHLVSLRQVLKDINIDAFIIPNTDRWQSESPEDSDKRLRFISNLDASAGYGVVTNDTACVLIDHRYTLTAKKQINTDLFQLEYYTEITPIDWAVNNLNEGQIIGFDPWLHSSNDVKSMQDICDQNNIKLLAVEKNPIDAIWNNRPAPLKQTAIAHELQYSGEKMGKKMQSIFDIMNDNDQTKCIISSPDSIAWMLNLRTLENPSMIGVQGIALIDTTAKHVELLSDVNCDVFNHDETGEFTISFKPLDSLQSSLDQFASQSSGILLNNDTQFSLSKACNGNTLIIPHDPCTMLKVRKNKIQQDGIRSSQRRDASAVKRAIERIKTENGLTEKDIEGILLDERSKDNLFRGTSFDSIVGWNANGAAIHGKPTDTKIKGNGFLLIDSGGQYDDGTTDITRTISIGSPTDYLREKYTLVLKAHIALANAIFPAGSTGLQIDALVRAPLWKAGIDFAHGTGHGVGHFLNVHEGPANISPKSTHPLQIGMFLSNEPGYYEEGHFGIRHENLVLVQEYMASDNPKNKTGVTLLCFETVTHVPFEDDCVIREMLTSEEIKWFDEYQRLSR